MRGKSLRTSNTSESGSPRVSKGGTVNVYQRTVLNAACSALADARASVQSPKVFMEMPNDKAKRIAADLGELFQDILDSPKLEEVEWHFRAEIRILRKQLEYYGRGLVSEEKLVALEKAVDDFTAIYEAEKAEAEKMPLSRHEAERLKKLFADSEDDYEPLDDKRAAH